MNFDKKKDRPLFQRTVESGCIPFCRELLPDFFRCMFPILPLLFDIRSAVSQLPDAFGTLKSWVSGSNLGGMQSGFSPCTAHFTIRRECPATASAHLCPVPADACPPGQGNFSKTSQPFSGGGLASRFSYQSVDKALTFHFLRATLELPTGQYWPRGNICLGGSLCRKLKKKR